VGIHVESAKASNKSIDDRPTLRGLTTGKLIITESGDENPCVLVCQAFPSWIFVVKVLKLRPVLVLLWDSAHAELIRPLVGQDCRILVGTITSASFAGTPMEKVKLDLIDRAPTSVVSGLVLEGLRLTSILYTKRLRQKLVGWNDVHTKIRHQEVGGVTHYTLQLGVLTKGEIPRMKPLGMIAPRDVTTVLSVMHPHYILRMAPGRWHIGDGECCDRGTEHSPFYHGGGWLPADLTPKIRVLTPGIYAPKGTWGIRPLTINVFLACKDVPESIVGDLGGRPLPGLDAVVANMAPGKCLIEGFAVFNGGGGGCEGGLRGNDDDHPRQDGNNQLRQKHKNIIHPSTFGNIPLCDEDVTMGNVDPAKSGPDYEGHSRRKQLRDVTQHEEPRRHPVLESQGSGLARNIDPGSDLGPQCDASKADGVSDLAPQCDAPNQTQSLYSTQTVDQCLKTSESPRITWDKCPKGPKDPGIRMPPKALKFR
jgi:hypothetical protein